jgi:hypothetical protein
MKRLGWIVSLPVAARPAWAPPAWKPGGRLQPDATQLDGVCSVDSRIRTRPGPAQSEDDNATGNARGVAIAARLQATFQTPAAAAGGQSRCLTPSCSPISSASVLSMQPWLNSSIGRSFTMLYWPPSQVTG